MKKLFILPFILFSLLACNENLDFEAPIETVSFAVTDSFYVPYETALIYAEQKLNEEGGSTRAANINRKVAEHYEYVVNSTTRSTGGNEDVRFHVINFENNQGYALVSADSRTTPVYAYSSTGNLNIDEAIENCGFDEFMDAATAFYTKETRDFINPPTPIIPTPTNPIQQLPIVEYEGQMYYVESLNCTVQNSGGILIKATWGQGWPYNYYCGSNNAASDIGYHNAAGCGPIAAAQIMSYFKYPASHDGYTLNWNAITSASYFYNIYPQISDNAKAVARLIHLVGDEANANYGTTTGTYIANMDDMFRAFGYSCTGPVNFNSQIVKTSLDNSSPVYFRGQDSNDNAHAWVIDSYKQNVINNTYYYTYEPYNKYITTTTLVSMYYHCNWGWDGSANGWFLNVFDGYNIDNRMIYNIRPNK